MAVQLAVLRLVAGLVEGAAVSNEMALAIGDYSGCGGPMVSHEQGYDPVIAGRS